MTLLNSHLKGENIIISDTKISNNNFTTQGNNNIW